MRCPNCKRDLFLNDFEIKTTRNEINFPSPSEFTVYLYCEGCGHQQALFSWVGIPTKKQIMRVRNE
jgi:hypothetical protein